MGSNRIGAVSFPGRRRPFIVVGVLCAIGVAGGVLFGIAAGNAGGLVAAAVFAAVLVPTARRVFDSGPALVFDQDGVDARAAGVRVPWSMVTGVRHDAMPTPGTGARGFLVLRLTEGEPERSGPLAPRPRDTKDGRELWISLTGVDANPGDVIEAARAQLAQAR
jgi:hypothetical protein